MLPFLLGWDCFKVFPQFDDLKQKFFFCQGYMLLTLSYYVGLFNIHLKPSECKYSPIKSSRSPDINKPNGLSEITILYLLRC
jgi:hypothetical protein